MSRNVTVSSMDLGWERIQRELSDLNGAHVDVGIFAEAGAYPDGTSVAQVGAWNEFGTSDHPERPFMRQTYNVHGPRFETEGTVLISSAIAGSMTMDNALKAIGAIQASQVKVTITDWTSPPNSPATIAIKGQNDPLVHSRLMRDSVQFKKMFGGQLSGVLNP